MNDRSGHQPGPSGDAGAGLVEGPAKETLTRDLQIINEKGLHARASAKFVETVERFDATALVERDGERVAGNSIMGLLMLTAPRGTWISVTTIGAQAPELMEALTALLADYFGEGM